MAFDWLVLVGQNRADSVTSRHLPFTLELALPLPDLLVLALASVVEGIGFAIMGEIVTEFIEDAIN